MNKGHHSHHLCHTKIPITTPQPNPIISKLRPVHVKLSEFGMDTLYIFIPGLAMGTFAVFAAGVIWFLLVQGWEMVAR